MSTGVDRGKPQATATMAVNAAQPKLKQAMPPLRPKTTPSAPIPGLSGGREATTQERDPHRADSEPPRNAGCTLQELCPVDKQKVAKLLKQIVDLGRENQALRESQATVTEQSAQRVHHLQECTQQMARENVSLKGKLSQMLLVLKTYQNRVLALDTAMRSGQLGTAAALPASEPGAALPASEPGGALPPSDAGAGRAAATEPEGGRAAGVSAIPGDGLVAAPVASSNGTPFAAPAPQPPLPLVVTPVFSAAAPAAAVASSQIALHPGMTTHPGIMPFHGGGTINITIQHSGQSTGPAAAAAAAGLGGRMDDHISFQHGQGSGTAASTTPPLGSLIPAAAAAGSGGQPPPLGKPDGASVTCQPKTTVCATNTRAGACTSCGMHIDTGSLADTGAPPDVPATADPRPECAAQIPPITAAQPSPPDAPVPATTVATAADAAFPEATTGRVQSVIQCGCKAAPQADTLPQCAAAPSGSGTQSVASTAPSVLLQGAAAPICGAQSVASTAPGSGTQSVASTAPSALPAAPRGGDGSACQSGSSSGGGGSGGAGAGRIACGGSRGTSSLQFGSVSATTIAGRAPRALVVNARSPTQQNQYLAELATANNEEALCPGPCTEAGIASPLLVVAGSGVSTSGVAASLLAWQVEQGLICEAQAAHTSKVLRFDPAIGSHGAFYLVDDSGESYEATAPKMAGGGGLRHNPARESADRGPRAAASAHHASEGYPSALAVAEEAQRLQVGGRGDPVASAAAEEAQRPQAGDQLLLQRWQQFESTPSSAAAVREEEVVSFPTGRDGGYDEGIIGSAAASAGEPRPRSSCGSVSGSSTGTSGMLRMADALDALAVANAWGRGVAQVTVQLQQQQHTPAWMEVSRSSGYGTNVSTARAGSVTVGFATSSTSGFSTSRSHQVPVAAAAAGAGEMEADLRPTLLPSSRMSGSGPQGSGSQQQPAEHLQRMEHQLSQRQEEPAAGGGSGSGLLFDDDSLVDILMQADQIEAEMSGRPQWHTSTVGGRAPFASSSVSKQQSWDSRLQDDSRPGPQPIRGSRQQGHGGRPTSQGGRPGSKGGRPISQSYQQDNRQQGDGGRPGSSGSFKASWPRDAAAEYEENDLLLAIFHQELGL